MWTTTGHKLTYVLFGYSNVVTLLLLLSFLMYKMLRGFYSYSLLQSSYVESKERKEKKRKENWDFMLRLCAASMPMPCQCRRRSMESWNSNNQLMTPDTNVNGWMMVIARTQHSSDTDTDFSTVTVRCQWDGRVGNQPSSCVRAFVLWIKLPPKHVQTAQWESKRRKDIKIKTFVHRLCIG